MIELTLVMVNGLALAIGVYSLVNTWSAYTEEESFELDDPFVLMDVTFHALLIVAPFMNLAYLLSRAA